MAANYDQPPNVEKRTRFFDGQYLQDQDFIDEQKYHIDRQRRHNRTLHIAGICDGFGIEQVAGPTPKITIAPGTAIDRDGRQLVVAQAQLIELSGSLLKDKTASLYLIYGEQPTDPQKQAGIEDFCRWLEQPEIKVIAKGDKLDSKYPPVLLAEIALDANGNITRINTNVREYSGLRLPGPNPDAPTLRSDASGLVRLEGGLSVSGNVGIGLVDPSAKLHTAVSQTSNILRLDSTVGADGTDVTQGIHLFKRGTALWGWKIEASGANDAAATLKFISSQAGADAARLTIARNSGNIGIGTPSPDNRLTITGTQQNIESNITQDVASHGLNIEADYVADNYLPGIVWTTNNNNPTKPKAGIWISEHGTGSRLYLGTSNNYATGITNKAIAIHESGNVGIGTLTPKAFQVALPENSKAGNAPGTGVTIAGGDSASIELRGTGTPYIDFAKDATTTDYHARIRLTATDKLAIEGADVGIGTTDPKSKLAINSKIAHDGGFSGFGDAQLSIFDPNHNGGNNPNGTRDILHLVREGVSGQAYGNKASLALGRYEHNGTNSRTQLDVKLTDGGFSSHTAVMTLRSNGNVGIGTSNPGAYRLNVSGGDTYFGGNLDLGNFQAEDRYLALKVSGGNAYRSGIKLWAWQENYGFKIEHDETKNGLNITRHASSGKPDATGETALFIANFSGNVGIGTTSPRGRLEISGPAQTGTGTISSSGTRVRGERTSFQTQMRVGDYITAGGQNRTITGIDKNEDLTIDSAFSPELAKNTAFTFSPLGLLINNGSVGIGTPHTGTFKLAVVHDSYPTIGVESSSGVGTWLRLNNTSPGGRNWNLISSGKDNGEKAGKLLINDQSSGGGTRMVIDTAGNVGIGTDEPGDVKLKVAGDAHITGRLWANSLLFHWAPDRRGWCVLDSRANNYTGNVGGQAAPSDLRFKTALRPIRNALEKVMRLEGKCYRWGKVGLEYFTRHIAESYAAGPEATEEENEKFRNAERQKAYQALSGDNIGLIAQELENVVPEAVHEDGKGYKYIQYQQLTALLVEAIKEQQALIQSLSRKVAALEPQ